VNVSENDSGIIHGRGSVMQMPWMTRYVKVTKDWRVAAWLPSIQVLQGTENQMFKFH